MRRLTKFVASYRQKYPASVAVTLMMGQLLSLLGRHDAAIGEYREALKILPKEPLVWLCLGHTATPSITPYDACSCLGVAKLGEAISDVSGDARNLVVMQAFTLFEEYARCRGHPQV